MSARHTAFVDRPLWALRLPGELDRLALIDLTDELRREYESPNSPVYHKPTFGRVLRFLQIADGRYRLPKGQRPTKTIGEFLQEADARKAAGFGPKAQACLKAILLGRGAIALTVEIEPSVDARCIRRLLRNPQPQEGPAYCRAIAQLIVFVSTSCGLERDQVLAAVKENLHP